ncbi:hypothetical protein HK097_006096 [Rhizophlyctis rosea]|uniref:Golgi to ER traffic protein 4 homolog n=1 Tax=Rhizophlyctis rosea TaxID=64517 RepID=A0AAD5X6K4_9FUNG|nr:hypothetical protein HK097_006096 [Rhizophlyctis rosea]
MAAGPGVEKTLQKLKKSVEDGNYYEAHQMYHSVSQRYLKQKKFDVALELLHQGAKNMVAHNQLGSAMDLVQRLIDVYDQENMDVNESTRGRLLDIFQEMPLQTQTCDEYVRLCIKWSARHGPCPQGDPLIHHAFGSRYYSVKQYYDAENHFIYGTLDSAKATGHMTWEWSGEGYHDDRGYFLLRSVLQYLALKKLAHATALFDIFTKLLITESPSDKSLPLSFTPSSPSDPPRGTEVALYKSSSINFAQFLILCVERGSPEHFITLRNQYRNVLSFDGWLGAVFEVVAEVWYDLGPKKPVNPFEDIMKSLFAPPPSGGSGGNGQQLLAMD